ncbi:MAG: YnfA family protein [Acidobacteriota bacterium]
MTSLMWYVVAAMGEIGGCFAFWAWLRMNKGPLVVVPGMIALVLFAMALTRIDVSNAGRAYAAYGGIYIVSSIISLWVVEGVRPDRWDVTGALISLVGTAVILFGRRAA